MSQGLSREALLSTPQPSTSHAQGDSDQVEPNLWTNLTNPHGPHPILRQDTLETNPICVDPNTFSRIPVNISQIPVNNSQGGIAMVHQNVKIGTIGINFRKITINYLLSP